MNFITLHGFNVISPEWFVWCMFCDGKCFIKLMHNTVQVLGGLIFFFFHRARYIFFRGNKISWPLSVTSRCLRLVEEESRESASIRGLRVVVVDRRAGGCWFAADFLSDLCFCCPLLLGSHIWQQLSKRCWLTGGQHRLLAALRATAWEQRHYPTQNVQENGRTVSEVSWSEPNKTDLQIVSTFLILTINLAEIRLRRRVPRH